MTTIAQNRRYFYAVMYFLIACVIAALLTSCSPYAPAANSEITATAAPSVTTTENPSQAGTGYTPTPRPSCTVTAYTLNFRSGPGTRYSVRDVLRNGERVQIIAAAADWLKVQTRNTTGFIYSAYCK